MREKERAIKNCEERGRDREKDRPIENEK